VTRKRDILYEYKIGHGLLEMKAPDICPDMHDKFQNYLKLLDAFFLKKSFLSLPWNIILKLSHKILRTLKWIVDNFLFVVV
jgi:hypothetical protein